MARGMPKRKIPQAPLPAVPVTPEPLTQEQFDIEYAKEKNRQTRLLQAFFDSPGRVAAYGKQIVCDADLNYDLFPVRPWITETVVKTPKELMDEELAGWPWKNCPQKLFTLSPFALNYTLDPSNIEPRFKLPKAFQGSSLFRKLFTNDIVARKLLDLIFENHGTAWKFWSTCQEAIQIYDAQIHLWDMAGTLDDGGYFHNCEKPRFGPNAPKEHWQQGCTSPYIVVAPVRRIGEPPSYYEQVRNLYTMSIAMNNYAEFMHNLHLHRINFLTPQLLALLIPKMTNLKVLGIYMCQLMPVAEIIRLLDIIKTDRPLGRENQIYLDFFPMWHQGPGAKDPDIPWSTYCTGTYGVVWDNVNFNTCLAIWSIVMRALPRARAQGIDLVSKHTAFRQWLDKGLLWRVEETLEAMQDPNTNPRVICALVDARNPDHYGNWHRWVSDIGCRPEGYEPYLKTYRCNQCKVDQLGIFFHFDHIFEMICLQGSGTHGGASITCYGCKLKITCQMEADHYKRSKRRLMKAWLHSIDDGWNTADLTKALSDFYVRNIIRKAGDMDDKRLNDMNRSDPNRNEDREYECNQKAIDYNSLGKHGSQKISPTADIPEDKEKGFWNTLTMDNRNAHGRK